MLFPETTSQQLTHSCTCLVSAKKLHPSLLAALMGLRHMSPAPHSHMSHKSYFTWSLLILGEKVLKEGGDSVTGTWNRSSVICSTQQECQQRVNCTLATLVQRENSIMMAFKQFECWWVLIFGCVWQKSDDLNPFWEVKQQLQIIGVPTLFIIDWIWILNMTTRSSFRCMP